MPALAVACTVESSQLNRIIQGEMDMDTDVAGYTKEVKSKCGHLLFTRFMEFLVSDKSLWRESAPCLVHSHCTGAGRRGAGPGSGKKLKVDNAGSSECPTPVHAARDSRIRVASAGTTCTDVSQMGVAQPD